MSDKYNPQDFENPPINWIPAIVLLSTLAVAVTVVPWYLWTYGVSASVWIWFFIFMAWTGISITAGYHRLLAHKTYETHPFIKYFLVLGATLAIESSAYDWCSGHREHHRHVDHEHNDPYSSSRGFWFSHIGWMLKKYPSGNYDYKNIPDLKKDKVLELQHKYYGFWVVLTNVGIVGALGLMLGDLWGTLLVVGVLRIVLTHHFTFFINSLCHMFGTRPYTDENTARDNPILALFTWGEGYHNYHHHFQYDYRNGIKWWQYDPTKWFIAGLSKIGLATNLKTVDDLTIRHAELTMKFKRAKKELEKREMSLDERYLAFKDRIHTEYAAFLETVEEWHALKAEAVRLKKAELSEHFQDAETRLKERFSQVEEKITAHGQAIEEAFTRLKRKTA
ncbi:MAG: fatty acid desaturase [Moraxella sp.]|nr:fatty acid desaturase [Moraxella sp.]